MASIILLFFTFGAYQPGIVLQSANMFGKEIGIRVYGYLSFSAPLSTSINLLLICLVKFIGYQGILYIYTSILGITCLMIVSERSVNREDLLKKF